MADFTKFRSALNGFNRSDVTAYIEASAAEHQTALSGLQKKLDEADEQLKAAQKQLQEQEAAAEGLRRELEQAKQELQEQNVMSNDLLQQLDETETALKATQDALEEALTPDPVTAEEAEAAEAAEESPDYAAMELEAYRRAEAMERLSAERTGRIRAELNDLLDQVSSRYEQTGQEIQVLTEDIRTNLQRLTEAMSDLDVIFDETTHHFDAMDAGPLESEEA